MRRIVALASAVLALAFLPVPLRATPAANQLVRCADFIAAFNAGIFSGSFSCPSDNVIVRRITFVTYAANNNACSNDDPPTYGDMIACRTSGSGGMPAPTPTPGPVSTPTPSGPSYSQVAVNISGTVSSTGNANYTITAPSTASVSSSAYPITWTWSGAHCGVVFSFVGGSNVASGSPSSGSYTGGSTGTLQATVTAIPTIVQGQSQPVQQTCNLTGSFSYYH